MKSKLFLKSGISYILCFVIALSMMALSPVVFAEDISSQYEVKVTPASYDSSYTPIYTKQDLYNIKSNDKYYLANDIIFTEEDYSSNYLATGEFYNKYFEDVGTFRGILDGCGHTIKGIRVLGHFVSSNYGIIRNIIFEKCYFNQNGSYSYGFDGKVIKNNYGTIFNCVFDRIYWKYGSGIVYENNNSGIVKNCFTKNNTEDNYLVYENSGKIDGCVNDAENCRIVASNNNTGIIENCINKADVLSNASGGIAENNNGKIMYCANYGNVKHSDSNYQEYGISGISYDGSGGVENCINKGTISSYEYAFGILCYGSALNCVNTGYMEKLSTGDYFYPICNSSSNAYNCYYLDTTKNSGGGGTALTAEQMKNSSSFEGFDFENIWQIKDGELSLQMENEKEIAIAPYYFPEKLTYQLGEKIDLSDMVVMAFTNKGDSYIVDDYTVNGSTDKLGDSTITISREGNSFSFTSKVLNDIGNTDITLSGTSFDYSGNSITPRVKVVDNGKTLIENRSYTLSYSNNINGGTAAVTITGMGNYAGSVTKNFTINRISQEISGVNSSYTKSITDSSFSIKAISSGDGSITYKSSNTTVAEIDENSGEVTINGAGTTTITITATQTNNYNEASKNVQITVAPEQVTDLKQTSSKTTSVKFSWSKVAGASGYEIYRYNSGSYKKIATITSGNTTSFTNSKLSAGKIYKYKVRAYMNSSNIYGSFSSVLQTATKPNKTKISSFRFLIGARSWVDVKYKKVSCTGYEIKFATKKSKLNSAKTYKTSKTKYSVMVNRGTIWYAKVRPYVKCGSKTYYGSWTSAKKSKKTF